MAETIEQLGIKSVISEAIRIELLNGFVRFFSLKIIGFVIAPNEFALPFEKGPTPKVPGRSPGHFEIGSGYNAAPVRTRGIRSEQRRQAKLGRDLMGQFSRVFKTHQIEHIFRPIDLLWRERSLTNHRFFLFLATVTMAVFLATAMHVKCAIKAGG